MAALELEPQIAGLGDYRARAARQDAGRRLGIAAALALAAGAALRLAWPGLVVFRFDEATTSAQVVQMLHSHTLPVAGSVASVGAQFPPLFDYLMAPPFLLSSSPIVATAYVAALNVAALILATLLVRHYAGPRAAYLAALLYALAPIAVMESRKIWNPYMEPLFAVLALWGLLALAVERRPWGAALFLSAWLWLLQLHPSALLLAPLAFGVFCVWRGALRLPPVLAGLVAGLLPMLPYLAAERGDGWKDIRLFLQAGTQPAHVGVDAIIFPLQNATMFRADRLVSEVAPFTAFLHPVWLVTAVSRCGVALLGLALLAAGVAAIRAGHVQGQPAAVDAPAAVYAIPLLWLVIPTLLALRQTTALFAHYFLHLLPVTFIVLALGLDVLCRRMGTAGSRLVVGAVTAYGLIATLPLLQFYGFLQTPRGADPTYARFTVAVAQASDAAPGAPVTLAMGDEYDVKFALLYLLQLQHPVAISDPSVTFLGNASAQLVVGRANSVAQPLQRWGGRNAVFHVAPGQEDIAVVSLPRDAVAARLAALPTLDVRLANGVAFLHWSAEQPNADVLRIALVWRVDVVDAATRGADDAMYVHLLRGDKTVAQHDDLRYPAREWQIGTTVYALSDLPLPAGLAPGAYDLRAGMYTRPAITRVQRVGPKGPEDGEFPLGTLSLPMAQNNAPRRRRPLGDDRSAGELVGHR